MTGHKRLFLEVDQSACGLCWEHRLSARQENMAMAIAQGHGLPDLLARVLAGRGVTVESAPAFLDPTIKQLLPDPRRLTDMEAAARRLCDAVLRQEHVAIFGDYDVDGAAAAALLSRFMTHYGLAADIYIPDRLFEGYGPNPAAMRELASRGASLIVTVDCGTNSAAAIEAARDAGADVIVLDHHQLGGALPACVAVVNPNRDDDLSGQGHLCATGVTFLTLVQTLAFLRSGSHVHPPPDLLSMLDLVALATICDVVPLTGVNRAFVAKGLVAARHQRNPGLAALARVARIGEPINAFHLAYLLGPRINAGGRIGDAGLGSRLLAGNDPIEAESIAATLDRLNQERQAIERRMLAEARAEIDRRPADAEAVVVTASAQWHPGVVGLIAARLKEHTRRPAFAVALAPSGIGTGSGRSIPGFDLGRLVRRALEEGLLLKGGGHAMAAGITIDGNRLEELSDFFRRHAAEEIKRLRAGESLKVDALLSADGATLDIVDALEAAGPFGASHPEPVFALPRHRLADARIVGKDHVRVDLRSPTGARASAMAFRAAESDLGRFLMAHRGADIHVAATLSANYWNGSRSAQLKVLDAAAPDAAARSIKPEQIACA